MGDPTAVVRAGSGPPEHPLGVLPGGGVNRRTVLVGILGLAGAVVVGVPVAEAAPTIRAGILETYEAAGGQAVLGLPVAAAVRRRISRTTTWGQRFERGTVWWGSGEGLADRPGERVRLLTAPNFRPVRGVPGLWRTGDLDDCRPLEKRVVADLGIRVMVAMNSGGDPSIPGVKRYRYRISNAGTHYAFYRGYVTRSANRHAVGKVLRRVGRTDAAVVVHCAAGKDRTGWVCDLMQSLAGVPEETRDLDYLATRAYSGAHVELEWLAAAREQLRTRYGTVEAYLRDGCELSAADLRRVRARLR